MSEKAEKTEKMPDASEESVGVNEQNANQQGDSQEPKNVQELTNYIQSMLQQMQDRFQTMSDQIISRIDDMATRIDDLEHNINDLMVQAGQEGTPAITADNQK
eukprot:11958.XXX_376383_376016_1 [CDS] Oithona nana genome sequencing.